MLTLLDLPLDASLSFLLVPWSLILAYLDPGTGSYFLQILLATLFGGAFALKQSWTVLKFKLFGRLEVTPRPVESVLKRPPTRDRSNDHARPGVQGHPTAKFH